MLEGVNLPYYIVDKRGRNVGICENKNGATNLGPDDIDWRIAHDGALMVRCPKCNRELQITLHEIDPNTGCMSPSFVCPWDQINKSCSYHYFCRLNHWWEMTCRGTYNV